MYKLYARFNADDNGWNHSRLNENMGEIAVLLAEIGFTGDVIPFEFHAYGFGANAYFVPTMHDWATRSDGDKLVMANNALYALLEVLKRKNIQVSAVQIEYTDSEGRKRGIFYR